MNAPITLYTCDVMHRRHFPQKYRFNYRVFSFLIDIDRAEKGTENSLVSLNRFNIFSVYTKDHAARDGTNWRDWINTILDQNSLDKAKHSVKLLCFPRILGYGFNPISLWYCYGKSGELYAIVCEVRNTFGEHHHYLIHNENEPYLGKVKSRKHKDFHVSPFISMDAEYEFSLEAPNEKLNIVINEFQNNNLMLTAIQTGKKLPFKTSNLLGQFFRLPLMTLKIMVMIHWQALKIWLRGGLFHKKPEASKQKIT